MCKLPINQFTNIYPVYSHTPLIVKVFTKITLYLSMQSQMNLEIIRENRAWRWCRISVHTTSNVCTNRKIILSKDKFTELHIYEIQYSLYLWMKSEPQSGDRVSCTSTFVGSFNNGRFMLLQCFKTGHDRFLLHPFTIYNTRTFQYWSLETLTVSQSITNSPLFWNVMFYYHFQRCYLFNCIPILLNQFTSSHCFLK